METFSKCIICGKTIEELGPENMLTEEHIIPKALGNEDIKFTAVCKKCNSELGSRVDDYLVNCFSIQLTRQQLGLKGQSGHLPNPFKKGKDDEGNIYYVDEHFRPRLQSRAESNGKTMSIHASSKEEAKKIALTKLRRMNASEEKIKEVLAKIEATEPKKITPSINYDIEMDINRLKLEALKIGYEYALLKLENYDLDCCAKEIQAVLKFAVDGEMEESCPKIDKVQYLGDKEIAWLKPLANQAHILMIQNIDNSVVVFVSLFSTPLFSFNVIVSNDASKYSFDSDPVVVMIK